MELDRRTRLLGAVLARTVGPVSGHSPRKRQSLRRRGGPQVLRQAVEGAPFRGVTTRDLVVPGVEDDVPVRLYVPRPAVAPAPAGRPLVVAFPGGGWVYGGVGACGWLCSQVAGRVDAVVAEVGYRRAPEHPAPAAHLDAYAATAWLAEHAERLGASPDRVALLGESAGGTLAATVALDARQRGRPDVAFQALLYPATDLTLSSPSITRHAHAPVLTAEDHRAFVALYLGDLQDPRDPLVSPLLADDHSGLPPTLLVTAEHDPLRDDGLRYVRALRSADVPVQHLEVPGSAHGFLSFARVCRSAAAPAIEALVTALRGALADEEPPAATGAVGGPGGPR